jgi:tetratricopeptide (TPR) repeat protein
MWGAATEGECGRLFRAPTPEVRERFAAACEELPSLAPAFGMFALLLQSPGLITPGQLGDACALVYKWADERGLVLTALLFAEAAAHADPKSPARANLAARTARRAALYDRAGAWHLRAYKLAVRARDSKENVWALIGYGGMMKETGRMSEARRFLQKAARRARGVGRKKEAAMAHHDLMNIALEMERYKVAEAHVRPALVLYPAGHPRIPALAHDFAFALLKQQHYGAALGLLERVLPLIRQPDERALVLGSMAWAAAGAGRRERFAEVERLALEMAGIYDRHAAAAFLHLAESARVSGNAGRAASYVEAALHAAERRQETHLVKEALAMGDALLEPCGPAPPDHPPSLAMNAILRELTARIRQWKEAPD